MDRDSLTIATRGSALALRQAELMAAEIEALAPRVDVRLLIVKTKGDKILDVPLAKVGGKGLFVKEIEEAILDGRADLAVHSMKDVPAELPEALFLSAIPRRADYRDALVSRGGRPFDRLPTGAKVGTSSLRRQSQLLYLRPDLNIVPLRGNIDTRLQKLDTEGLDAIVLAAAGLERMNMTDRATQVLAPDLMLPAIGQGALGIESRRDDAALNAILAQLDHGPTAVAVTAERAYLATMEGSCQVPLGALASVSPDGRTVSIQAFVADPDGGRLIGGSESAPVEQAADAGRALGRRLLADGGRAILDDLLGPSSTR